MVKFISTALCLSVILAGCSFYKHDKPKFEPKTIDLLNPDLVSESFNTTIPEKRLYPFVGIPQQPKAVDSTATKDDKEIEPGISSVDISGPTAKSQVEPKQTTEIQPKVTDPDLVQPKVEASASENQIKTSKSQRDDIAPAEQYLSIVRSSNNLSFCNKVNKKLSSVSFKDCLIKALTSSDYQSSQGEEILFTDFDEVTGRKALGRVLLLGGVHGDELTSVTSVFKWISTLKSYHSGLFVWRVVPLVNPDGFFLRRSTRTNANGVDLNRNLPTKNWDQLAVAYWKKRAEGSPRKYPGPHQSSEPETKWLIDEINRFQPDVIVTVHAPYNLVDFDAKDRSYAPGRLGILRGKSLGTFPGSLGRYAGEEQNIPVVTIELPHSYNMPTDDKIRGIWVDLISWLRVNIANHQKTRLVSE